MNNIPKVIHYCWFGNNPMPEHLKMYVDNWKRLLNDYQIIEWNEKNFDVNLLPFTKEAYDARVWAFVSDFVRLYALYHYGGVYLDTDVELIGNFDHLLNNSAFCGFESRYHLGSAVLGSEKGNKWIEDLMNYYNDMHFVKEDGTYDKTANTVYFTEITKNHYKLILNNKFQNLKNVTIYPRDYFYPDNLYTRKLKLTKNSVAIHHWNKSWCDPKNDTYKDKIRLMMYQTFGDDITEEIYKKYWQITKKFRR